MNNDIKLLVESYYCPTEQMINSLKDADRCRAKYEKNHEARQEFAIKVFGKKLYNKLLNHGAYDTYAPIPWSALKITVSDFKAFEKTNFLIIKGDELEKLIRNIAAVYVKNQFIIRGDEIYSDIVFNTFDSVIDFFEVLYKLINKIYTYKLEPEYIDWKAFCKKINNYLK